MWMLLCVATIPNQAGEKTLPAEVVSLNKSYFIFLYQARNGRSVQGRLKITEETKIVKGTKPIRRQDIRKGSLVEVTAKGGKALQIRIPEPRPVAPKEEADEEVLVDGEIKEIDFKDGKIVLTKTDGKPLGIGFDSETEVRRDGLQAKLEDIKKESTVRIAIYKKARKASRIFIYEVTSRPDK